MKQVCRSCGREAAHVVTTFEVGGKRLPEPKDKCEYCGEGFKDAFIPPSEQRFHMGWEVNPHGYKKMENEYGTIMVATDETLQDNQDSLLKPSDDYKQAIESSKDKKRKNRRLEPMSEEETARTVEALNRYINEQKTRSSLEEMGIVLPE